MINYTGYNFPVKGLLRINYVDIIVYGALIVKVCIVVAKQNGRNIIL